MKTFVLKSLIFVSPFLLLIGMELVIDPFNYFSSEKNRDLIELKEKISQKDNPYLYKLIQYERKPYSTIILGDSRTNLLSPALFEACNKEKVSNLSVGGSSLQDAFEMFWYVSARSNIKKVYLGISLETYNGSLLRNRAKQTIEIKNSFLLYLFNRYTFSSTMLICKAILLKKDIDLYKPPFGKDEFWKFQLNKSSRYLMNYSYPVNYFNELKKISDYCVNKDIKLVFVLSPTHFDLQNKIHEFNLDEAYIRFKLDISSFGDVYDFNYPNVITISRNNFSDPFHHNLDVSKIIIEEITGNKTRYSKCSHFAKIPSDPELKRRLPVKR